MDPQQPCRLQPSQMTVPPCLLNVRPTKTRRLRPPLSSMRETNANQKGSAKALTKGAKAPLEECMRDTQRKSTHDSSVTKTMLVEIEFMTLRGPWLGN